ncbi:MAG: hypothetical protein U0636_07925 [Phycisphaerales bacterium]
MNTVPAPSAPTNAPRIRRRRRRATPRRGAALLLAIFSMVVVGTTTAAYVSSRETGVMVSQNAQAAADARAMAAAGMDMAKSILRENTSNWRTGHSNGTLLSNYSLDGGTVNISLVDLKRKAAGVSNPVPNAATTEVEVTVRTTRDGTTWTSVADMSIPSVAKGEFAVFAERYMTFEGSRNFIGRWPNAPLTPQNLRLNVGTNAKTSLPGSGATAGSGIWLKLGCAFETQVAGALAADADSQKSTWVYYPYAGTSAVIQGVKKGDVAVKRMEANESVSMIPVPATPSASSGATNYTSAQVLNGVTRTYNAPFKIKALLLPALFTRNFECRNNSVVTLTAGTYEIWGSWILRSSRVIIQGDVKIVVNPNLALTGLDWQDSSVELDNNATLEIYNGYSADVRNCWVGARYICTTEPNATKRDGDAHKKAWWNQFAVTACDQTAPSSPRYIEPWRIRFYPMAQFLSSLFTWDYTDSSIVGSLYLPTNAIRLYGKTVIWGRVAARDFYCYNTSSVYYDHALDEVSGLTEGMTPARGGDRSAMFPIRVVRYGFDAESAR